MSFFHLFAISTIDMHYTVYYLHRHSHHSQQLLSLWLWVRLLSALGIACDGIKIFGGILPITHLK